MQFLSGLSKKEILVIVITVLGALASQVIPRVSLFMKEYSAVSKMERYRPQVLACADQKRAEAAGRTIVGLEYECALDIAATFYAQDQATAIRLCQVFYPLPPTLNADKVIAEYEQRMQTTVCRTQITARLSATSSTMR